MALYGGNSGLFRESAPRSTQIKIQSQNAICAAVPAMAYDGVRNFHDRSKQPAIIGGPSIIMISRVRKLN
jgi:hypothetical protein